MIAVKNCGYYRLFETKHHVRILALDNALYAWIKPLTTGQLLVLSHRPHAVGSVLSAGDYCIFEVVKEPELADTLHLELEVGDGTWQGYLMPTGLPTRQKARSIIIPTNECIMADTSYSFYTGAMGGAAE